MEVVAASASLIAVIQVTASVIRVSSEYIRGVKGSTKAAERLRNELKDFRSILEKVEEQAETERANGGEIAEMKFLSSIHTSFVDCNQLLVNVEKRLDTSSAVVKYRKALTWPFREKEIEKCISSLHNFKGTFQLALSLDST